MINFIFLFSLLIVIITPLNITTTLSNNEDFQICTNGTISNLFLYKYNIEKRCNCQGVNLYYTTKDIKFSYFHFELNQTDVSKISNEKVKVYISNKNISSLNYSIQTISQKEFIITINETCSFNNINLNAEPGDSWGIISIIADNYRIDYVKYCNTKSSRKTFSAFISTILIFSIATLYLFLSTNAEIILVYSNDKPKGELTLLNSFMIVIFGSICLLCLFYFSNEFLFRIFVTLFLTTQLSIANTMLLNHLYDISLFKNLLPELNKVIIQKYSIQLISIINFLITIIIVTLYLTTRHWILNNILTFSLCYLLLSLYHFRSFRACIYFLILFFFYDVFWVYISPLLFESNVMVHAATNINLPFKLEMPLFLSKDHPMKSCLFLGLGDIAVPGFVIKFLKRFDFIKESNVYYIAGIFLFVIAILLSGAAVFVFNAPQPVLFYMSPCLIIGILAIAGKRGDVNDIFNSDKVEDNINFIDRKNKKIKKETNGDLEVKKLKEKKIDREQIELKNEGSSEIRSLKNITNIIKEQNKQISLDEDEDDDNDFEEINS